MRNEECIYVPISFEFLLSNLFGNKTYHGFVGIRRFGLWKKSILRVFGSIKKSISVNIDVSDSFHKETLLDLCDRAEEEIKKAKNKDMVNVLAIEYLIQLIFNLEGDLPNNWNKDIVNRNDLWKVNKYRKIAYLQTDEQKVRFILSLEKTYPYNEQFSYRELSNKFHGDLNGNINEFIIWFKEKYSDLYLKIF